MTFNFKRAVAIGSLMFSQGARTLCERFLYAHANSKSAGKRQPRNPDLSSPIREAERLSAECNKVRGSSISGLLSSGNPLTVIGRISLGIVCPIELMRGGRTWPNIGIESLKRSLPFRAYGYTPTAVVLVVWTVINFASAQHERPNSIFRRSSLTSSCHSMSHGHMRDYSTDRAGNHGGIDKCDQ